MSSNVLGAVVGGAVGFLVGGPTGALIGAGIGLAGSALVGGLGVGYDGPRLSDLSVQTSTYGADIPRVHSTIVVSGNVLWLENNKLRERVRKVSGGGKGGSDSATKEYTYFATFHLGLCEGPVAGIRRIWCSDKLLYDAGSDDLETVIAGNAFGRNWTFYSGSDDQLPTARYEADVGVGNATGHRGLCYIEFRDFELTDYGNTLEGAQFRVELIKAANVESPAYMYDREYDGQPVYADSAVFITATHATTEFVEIGGTEYCQARMFFNTYNHDGALIKVSSRTARLVRVGTTSIGAYRARPINGTTNFAIHDAVNDITGGDVPEFAGEIPAPTPWDYAIWSYAGGSYWFQTVTGFLMVRGSELVPVTVPGLVNYASIFIAEDAATGRVYIRHGTGTSIVGELNPETGAILWSEVLFTGTAGVQASPFACYGGRMLVHDLNEVRVYDVSGTTAELVDSVAAATARGPVHTYAPSFGITTVGVYQISERSSSDNSLLSDVIEQEVELSGLLSASDIDVTALTQEVKGYRVTGGSIRAALEPLAVAYQFDIVPSGYRLKAVPRGQSSVLTVPYADLGATASDTPSDVFKLSREMDSQLPAKTVVKYLDAAREYDIGEQAATRINTEAVNEVESELALVLGADEAAGIAEVLQARAWLERADVSFTLPPMYLALEPCDVITVQTPDADYEVLASELEYTQDGRIEVKAKPNAAAVYTPNASGGEGNIPPGTIGVAGPSLFVPLDIPVVDETVQNAPGFVGTLTGYTGGWPGGVVYRSPDNGQTWVDLQAWSAKCTIGSTPGALAEHDGYLIDQSQLNVIMISGALESITRDQLLAGYNYAAYGMDGRWEIVRFQNADLQADGSYTVYDFVRGDKGTEWATGLHQPGDWFVLLGDPDNAFISMAAELIGIDRLYRGITQRASIDTGEDVPFTYQGVNLEPLSPVDASATRDGSGNLTATFVRRSRLSSSWWGTGVVAPVGEATQAFEVDVLDGSTVVRTIETATEAFSYSAADQTTDFGSPQSSITFRIYQLSETVGRGYAYEVTL
ncbi:MAG: phage tail protein [Pseudomonadota bacterium]|nr:phage tail protein [Pseudomonadota bacterium]